jgi:tetratricopeptide (TPR) repeat protein
VVFYKVDAEGEEGVALKEEFAIGGYPTFIVANAEAETISRWWGYDTADEFIDTVAEAMADPTTIAEKKARHEAQPTARDASVLGNYHMTRKEGPEAVEYLRTAFELDPDEGHEYDLFYATYIGFSNEDFTAEELKVVADQALASPNLDAEKLVDVARNTVRAFEDDDPEGAAVYIAAGLAASEGTDDPELQKERSKLLISEALLVKNDPELALGLVREGLPEGWEEDAGRLNGFAWWCFENEVNLEEAEALARKGAELAEDDSQKAQILDTTAEIAYLRGNQAEAVALIQQAITLDPESEGYGKQLDRFSDSVAEGAASSGEAAE